MIIQAEFKPRPICKIDLAHGRLNKRVRNAMPTLLGRAEREWMYKQQVSAYQKRMSK